MIPETVEEIEVQDEENGDKTYYLNFDKKRIQGEIDGLPAVRQSIIAMLETERYAHVVHTWQYGASMEQYIGQSYDYVTADIGREISDTLLTDDRILNVYGFKFEQIEDKLKVHFSVDTVYGTTDESVVI